MIDFKMNLIEDIKELSSKELTKEEFKLADEQSTIVRLNGGTEDMCATLYFVPLLKNNYLTMDNVYNKYGEDVSALVYDVYDFTIVQLPASELAKCNYQTKLITAAFYYVSIEQKLMCELPENYLEVFKETKDLHEAIKELLNA